MVTWLYVFEPMLSQNMGQGHLSHDKHKAELNHNEKELGQDVLFKDMPPVTYCPQPVPTLQFHHISIECPLLSPTSPYLTAPSHLNRVSPHHTHLQEHLILKLKHRDFIVS